MLPARLRTAAARLARSYTPARTLATANVPAKAPGAAVPAKREPLPGTDATMPPPSEITQSPNRTEVWSRSQRPRSEAMTGPRFEQTDYSLQPQPYSAMELVHKQPVQWTHDRIVACDGGGGPAGHPRVFINTDKPEIAWCTYCGSPYANEHHRAHLEALPETSYPLA